MKKLVLATLMCSMIGAINASAQPNQKQCNSDTLINVEVKASNLGDKAKDLNVAADYLAERVKLGGLSTSEQETATALGNEARAKAAKTRTASEALNKIVRDCQLAGYDD